MRLIAIRRITNTALTAGAEFVAMPGHSVLDVLACELSAEPCGEQLTLGSGTVCEGLDGLDSDADADVTELAGEEAMSMSLMPFGCTITIRKPSSLGASRSATPHPRLARCDFVCTWVCTCACALPSNQFASMDPFAYGAQAGYGYGRNPYGASCPGGGGAEAYWYAWNGPGAGVPYVYDGRSGYGIGE